ncbi:hypothetical protein N9M41_02945, partial [Rhodopirellula sp.]|nr:hypothetical protein [Rhodopirellula sp.]
FDPVGALGLAKAQAAFGDWKSVRETLASSSGTTPELVGLLGRCAVEQQDWAELQNWSERIVADPASASLASPDALFALGTYEARKGESRRAADRFIQALILDSTDVAVYEALSRGESGRETARASFHDRSNSSTWIKNGW